jgi:hypothetical protein
LWLTHKLFLLNSWLWWRAGSIHNLPQNLNCIPVISGCGCREVFFLKEIMNVIFAGLVGRALAPPNEFSYAFDVSLPTDFPTFGFI